MWGVILPWLRWGAPIILAMLAGYEGHYNFGEETRTQEVRSELAASVVATCTDTVRVETKTRVELEKVYPEKAFVVTRGDAECLVVVYPDGQRHTVGCRK